MRILALLIASSIGCGGDPVAVDSGVREDATVVERDAGHEPDGGSITPARWACPAGIAPDPAIGQALPSIDFDDSYPAITGRLVMVREGGDLQAAIDGASPGDVIAIDPDAIFVGPFVLPEKEGDGWIVIRTAAPDAMLPPEGGRVDPAVHAPFMPDFVTDGAAIFETAPRAHHYRLVGLELSPAEGTYANALVSLGSGSESSAGEQAHHLVIDRSYLRADPEAGTRRGVALNSGATSIVGSYFEGFFELGADSQAIAGWNGPGPYRILGNHLEGASENVLFGGADPAIENLVPADIEVCGNHFTKPVEWYGMARVVKNLFELKNARRVLVAGNVFEHNWTDGQQGMSVVLTPRNQDGAAPWSTIEDVTFARNVIRRVGGGIGLLGEDDNHPSGQQRRVVIEDNFIEIDTALFEGKGRAFEIIASGRPVSSLLIAHNTVRIAGDAAIVMGDAMPAADGLIVRGNILAHAIYGIFGSGVGEGTASLDAYAPGYIVTANILIAYPEGMYPPGNFFPANEGEVGFAGEGRYALSPSSPFAGVDAGRDPGVDWASIEETLRRAVP